MKTVRGFGAWEYAVIMQHKNIGIMHAEDVSMHGQRIMQVWPVHCVGSHVWLSAGYVVHSCMYWVRIMP